ncbi:valine--tRNA ligase [Micrococcales bacterium 31B]|nr:valine--tRNA ligase [Micrococcales bacterium 31B]
MTENSRIPDKVSLDGLESKWDSTWSEQGTYTFDRTATRNDVYSIDTPPPTASGSLHVGHVFSYTQTDVIARFKRMSGKHVFYPMGWDDNGLPTERRVQNYYGVRCDPSAAYIENYTPPREGGDKPVKPADQVPISRQNFVELCLRLTSEDEKAFEETFRRLGLSVDWSHTYQTIAPDAQAASQRAFLRNLQRGEAYQLEAPTLWDVTFRTAVAQAELVDQEQPSAYHRISFWNGDEPVYIETTRPELLPACVALVAHPDDERYQPLFGKTVTSPLFRVEVPVKAHALAQPDKGAGIAMICTFGDTTDVTWWRELNLPTRAIIGRDGRLLPDAPEGFSPEAAARYADLAGLTVFSAKAKVVEWLQESGDLVGEPTKITHPVKFYEKGDKPLEIVASRQWYITNGGRDDSLRDKLIARGRDIAWHPGFMGSRYENWVSGLNGDWLISRQRFFGVPFPVWYGLDEHGEVDYDTVLTPTEAQLPVDPQSQAPDGFDESQRGQPGGFVGDPDVMDTWATSSLTPQIAGGWERDADLFGRVFPFDLRPQAHDIIRTWLFATVVRAHHENHTLPWSDAGISGWILDPDRKKMGKSTGNAMTPVGLLDTHGTDAVRYWAASAKLGGDTAFDEGQMKIGRRLAIKILNASKFALSWGSAPADPAGVLAADPALVTVALDRAMLAGLAEVVERATQAFSDYEYSRALEVSESFFWAFCDDYLELIKDRAYGGFGEAEAASARAALAIALQTMLRLFAPFLPFATEEVWSWWREGSVHRQTWPVAAPIAAAAGDGTFAELTLTGLALAALRKAKSEAKVSQKTEIIAATLAAAPADLEALTRHEADLRAAGRATSLTFEATEGTGVPALTAVELGEPPVKQK